MRQQFLASCLLVSALSWVANAQTQIDLRTQGKNVDFSGAAATKPYRTGTLLPATCSLGEAFFKTDAPAGENLYTCTAANVWTLQRGSVAPLGGDVTGSPGAATVERIRGRNVTATVPGEGEVLRWNATGGQWEPYPSALAGGVNYSQAFTNQTLVTIAGSAHGLNTAYLVVACYDQSSPEKMVEPDAVTVHPTSYDVTVQFTAAQSGRCVVNGSGGGYEARTVNSNTFAAGTVQTFQGALVAAGADRTAPAKSGTSLPATCTAGDQFFQTNAAAGQNLYFCTAANTWTQMNGSGGGGGQVASVFGRTGAVTAQAGDYSFPQVSGTVTDSQVSAGVNASKIGAGLVTNTAFGYLANVNADLQTQVNGKAAVGHSHTGGGDVSGDIASLTVTRLQTRSVSVAAPADGQALLWSAGANAWQPGSVAGGGGASMASQLGDLAVTQTSNTVLTIGANCSTATPCNVRFGNTVYSLTRSCAATLGAGTGTAFLYVASGGTLTIGHNMTVNASAGCVAQPSVTSFPYDAIPLYTWTATGGTWDSGGGRDLRALLSLKAISAGSGVTTADVGGRTTVSVDAAVVPRYATGTVVLNFPSIAAGQCAADQSITVSGAALGDAVAPGWPTTLEPGLVGIMRVSGTDTVAVRLCNLSGAAIDPANATFRATIVKNF